MKINSILCILLSMIAINCKRNGEAVTVQFQKDAAGNLRMPQTKDELVVFIEKNVSPEVLNSTLSMRPYDVLFKRSQLSDLITILYYGRIPIELFEYIRLPGFADILFNPANTLAAWVYAEKKGLSMEVFHLEITRDERFRTSTWGENKIEPKNPWGLDTTKWRPDVPEWDSARGKMMIVGGVMSFACAKATPVTLQASTFQSKPSARARSSSTRHGRCAKSQNRTSLTFR